MFAWPISTASRTGSQRLKLLAGLLLFYGLAASVAATPAARAATHEHVLRVLPNDRLTRDHLQRALAGSATARELVSRIERLQNVVLIVRAHPLLVRQDGLLGRGKFWVVRGRLFGLLEYQAEPIGSNRAVRILAHEVAHALEVALAPRGFDTNSLRSLLLARESEERAGPVPGIETEFARAVGYRVQLELLNKSTGPSTLSAIAEEMHLALDPRREKEGRPDAGPHSGVLRIEGGDSLTARHLAELERRSATGRELLHRVERLPATVLIIRAYPLLVKTTGLYGHGRFWVTDGRLFGYLRYQTESLGNDRPLCIIVHELAHAVELAGVDRREGTKAIREFVLSRALGDDPPDWRGSETEFPRTITHHVWLELLGRLRGPSALDSLALARGVSLPPTQAAQAAPEEPRPSASRSAKW